MRVAAWPVTMGDTGNPYPRLLYQHLGERGVETEGFVRSRVIRRPPDIIHAHWPQSMVEYPRATQAFRQGAVLLAAIFIARLRGARVVWTAHNLLSHEREHQRLSALYWRLFLAMTDGWITLGASSGDEVRRAFPVLARRRSYVVHHGDYKDAYPRADRASARAAAGIEATEKVVLFFGQVRAYKGIPELVEAFKGWKEPCARLIVAGRPNQDEFVAPLEAASAADTRIELRLRFIPDDEIAQLFALSDLVVLPFRSVLNSGSALLALSFDRPLLLPAAPSFSELQANVGAEWVRTYDGAISPAALAAATAGLPAPGSTPDLGAYAWDRIAEQTEAAYADVIRNTRRRLARLTRGRAAPV